MGGLHQLDRSLPIARTMTKAFFLVVAAAIVVACGGPTGAEVDELEDMSYDGLTESDYRAFLDQRESLIAECMEEAGFAPSGVADSQELRWGLEPGEAYGVSQSVLDAMNEVENPEEVPVEPSPGYKAQSEACLQSVVAEEETRLASVEADRRYIDRLVENLYSSEEYLEAQDEWSDCMTERGHDFETRQEITRYFGERLRELTAGEIENVDRSAILGVRAEEQDVFEADQACGADTIDRVLLDGKRRIFEENWDRIQRIRNAYLEPGG